MNIRQATVHDVKQIEPLLQGILSPHIESWLGDVEQKERSAFIRSFLEIDHNALSYQYCHVYEVDSLVAGVISHYPGHQNQQLFEPILDFLKKHYPERNDDFFEDDVDPDDYYINLLSVSSQFRGRGIGNQLISFAEDNAKVNGYSIVSLNVANNNLQAQKLYERLGYCYRKTSTSDGVPYRYLVKEI